MYPVEYNAEKAQKGRKNTGLGMPGRQPTSRKLFPVGGRRDRREGGTPREA
jgi:hypothetical protein